MTATSKYGDATDNYEQILELQVSILGENHDDIASTYHGLGLSKIEQGLFEDALVDLNKSLHLRLELHGESHAAVGDTCDVIGFAEAKIGRVDTALSRLEDGLKTRLSSGDRLGEANTLLNLGNLHRRQNELDMALQRYNECVNIRASELGETHRSVADVLMAIGNVYSDMEKPEEALRQYSTALHILCLHEPNGQDMVSLLLEVGMILYRAGDLENALPYFEQTVELYSLNGGGYEAELINALFIIGTIHSTFERTVQSQQAWNDAYFLSKNMGGLSDPDLHQELTQLLQDG
jgi:tetratricopeptide (TPR) repeat protein